MRLEVLKIYRCIPRLLKSHKINEEIEQWDVTKEGSMTSKKREIKGQTTKQTSRRKVEHLSSPRPPKNAPFFLTPKYLK